MLWRRLGQGFSYWAGSPQYQASKTIRRLSTCWIRVRTSFPRVSAIRFLIDIGIPTSSICLGTNNEQKNCRAHQVPRAREVCIGRRRGDKFCPETFSRGGQSALREAPALLLLPLALLWHSNNRRLRSRLTNNYNNPREEDRFQMG